MFSRRRVGIRRTNFKGTSVLFSIGMFMDDRTPRAVGGNVAICDGGPQVIFASQHRPLTDTVLSQDGSKFEVTVKVHSYLPSWRASRGANSSTTAWKVPGKSTPSVGMQRNVSASSLTSFLTLKAVFASP